MEYPTDQDFYTPEQAAEAGYWAMSKPLKEQEDWIERNICADLKRSGTPFVIVSVHGGREVWRAGVKREYETWQKKEISKSRAI